MQKKYYKYIIMAVLSLACVIFTYNDYFLYKTPILKINHIENEYKKTSTYGEDYYTQTITGVIKNGKYKGKKMTFTNTMSTSGVYGEQVHKNTELFLDLSNDGSRVVGIANIKRDKYLVILLVIFLDLIILVAGKKGCKTLISLFGNIIISACAIIFFKNNFKTVNMLLLYFFVSTLYIVFSLYVTNGKSRKTLAAIVSSVVSLFVSFGLSYAIIKIFGKDINLYIWAMEYNDAVYDYENFFYVSVLLCGLGAIMDIAITIASSLSELMAKDPHIEVGALVKSGREISKDIVGTMTTVMLYTCYTPIIPTVLLALKNSMPLMRALDLYGTLELVIILCSCISIVLAIPVSQFVSVFILKQQYKKEAAI